MKKLLTILVTLPLCIGLFGCAEAGGSVHNSATESKYVPIAETGNYTEVTNTTETAAATPATESANTTDASETTQTAHTHKWTDATCSAPKTCVECGATSGLTAGHDFSDGKCISCGKAESDYAQETTVWIPTKGGTKYHSKESCSGMDSPSQVTQFQAEQQGFTPCKKCCK